MNARVIVWTAIGLFWSAIIGLGVLATREPANQQPMAATAERSVHPSGSGLDAARVAQHATPDDCWIIVRGRIYDVSRYIPEHPTAPRVITEYCGKDATWAFETKARGRPHSPRAYRMLEDYQVRD